MSLHDEYARITPFEIAFPDLDRFDALVAAVAEEATRRRVDATDLEAFGALTSVGRFLSELHGEDVPRVELLEHGVLLFHAVHFARAGHPLYLLEATVARLLVREVPGYTPSPPSLAGYLQLPRHLFWAGASRGGAPESLDGLFWTLAEDGRIHVLPIMGVRPDRAGFGALSLPDAPLAHARHWLDVRVRDAEADFSSRFPGAELDGLYAVESAGEVLKLLARFFAHVSGAGTALEAPRAVGEGSGPRPSSLPFARVRRVVPS